MMNDELEKLYEDEHLAVFNKPSGMVVNRSNTYDGVTMQDIVSKMYPDIFEGSKTERVMDPILSNLKAESGDNALEESSNLEMTPDFDDGEEVQNYPNEFINRAGIVHRLDKDTSGAILFAKKENIFKNLQKQFKKRKIRKHYIAMVFGKIYDDVIEIDAPMGRNPKNPLRFSVNSEGKDAITHIEKRYEKDIDEQILTLLDVYPRTGRTHQIRVHLSAMGNSVVNDPLYSTKRQIEWSNVRFDRLMLHSTSLEFLHPINKMLMKIEAEEPKEFKI